MVSLEINISNIKFKNPILVASGTFGYGEEYKDFVDLNKLGGVVTKTISLKPKEGNPPPRIVETASGILNSIGMQNKGVEDFIKNKLPFLRKFDTKLMVSIGGKKVEEYVKLAKILDEVEGIDALEMNISCPNIGRGQEGKNAKRQSKLFSQDAKETYKLVSKVKRTTKLPLIVKLSPNVTDITEIAKAAEDAGGDAISLINSLSGMAVDVKTKRPKLGNVFGGLSGPAIKPVALYNVHRVYNSVKIPIIGMGGIYNLEDALEFIICGAKAIALGTVNFIHPKAAIDIILGIKDYLKNNQINDINKLWGSLRWEKDEVDNA